MTEQTKKGSLIEAMVNTLIGFIITCIFAPLIYWIAGIHMNIFQMSYSTLLFTILSVARGYVIRRWFNGKIYKSK